MSQVIPFELQSLADAHRYQRWLFSSVQPFLGKRILELGSGIGNLSQHLPQNERLILSDVEASFVANLQSRFPESEKLSVVQLDPTKSLVPVLREEDIDTVVSFNVLEHVENDAALLADLIQLLKASKSTGPKRIVSLVPAHQWAYGPVDQQFGHFRRYSDSAFRLALEKAGAGKLSRQNYFSSYMNFPGLLAWWINGKLIGNKEIGPGNMKFFELLCPVIRPIDNFLHRFLKFPFGNSLIAVYWVTHE